MKVPAINFNNNFNYRKSDFQISSSSNIVSQDNMSSDVVDCSGVLAVYPVSFMSIQNSSKLRILFSYGLPCMYSGIPMIDPKQLTKMLKNQTFLRPASQVLEILKPHKDSFIGMEANVLEIIKERAQVYPDKNIQELLKEVEPVFRRRLRKTQAPIFHRLTLTANELPEEYHSKFVELMEKTNKKLDEKPVIIPFSSYEFRYKLCKIKDDIMNGSDIKSKKVMNKLIKESKKLSGSTNPQTIENQKEVLNFLDIILKRSVLKNNEQLKTLLEMSKSRLTQQEIIVPFSRKSFIYDLAKLVEDLPDNNLQQKLLSIAQELPTSGEKFSAYILKISAEPPEKIGHRLLWPSLASVEHIFPKSCGGLDILANFGGATTRENSTRKSLDFMTQIKLRPKTKEYCQKYVDRLIDLYHEGIFARHNINPKYITDFKKTIYIQSRRTIELDTSKLYGTT